jgi:predicted DNA-binding protein (MmcQ/YjbR family)
MSAGPLRRLRKLCLALPEATERQAWGSPTFRVRNKMFAMFADNHHDDGRIAVWCKAAPGAQEVLVRSPDGRFFVPPYVGVNGWIGVRLEGDVDWETVAALLEDGYRLIAPKRVAAQLDGGAAP